MKNSKRGNSHFEKDGRTKDCFFHDKTDCVGKIKNAHSFQKNGVLSIIELYQWQDSIEYCFQRMNKNEFDQYLGFEKIGKGAASNFLWILR